MLRVFVLACVCSWPLFRVGGAEPARERLAQSSRLTSLVISEIMYHPAARADGKNLEFIELFNALDTPEDISGYRLAGDVGYTFPAGTVIPGGAFRVVARSPADLQAIYNLSGVLGPFEQDRGLPNNNGRVELRNRLGAVLLSTSYQTEAPWPAAADGAGHSIVLARPSLGAGDPAAWAPSHTMGGSPGALEPSGTDPAETVVINEFLANTDAPDLDYIELYNRGTRPVDISGCVLTDDSGTDKFVISPNTVIAPGEFRVFDETTLQFALSSAGESIYFKNAARDRVLDAVRFGPQQIGVSTGRFPDGNDAYYRLQTSSKGARNSAVKISDVIINEIMFHPISENDDDQYLELYNRSAVAVDLGGWRLEDGVDYTFPLGTVMGPDAYLVVARSPSRLLTLSPTLSATNTVGPFNGRLSAGGERIALAMPDTSVSTNRAGVIETNLVHIIVDEATYRDGGRWGKWADGGGSSLERVDARADGRLASNWADSEPDRGPWTTVSKTGRLDNGNVSADQLQVLLQGAGECLIDEVEVIDSAGANHVANSTFEGGSGGWTAEGTEAQSAWEPAEGYSSANSYHVRAVERGDNQLNRIRTQLTSALASGTIVTIRAKVRWIRGHPEILFRLRGNWLEAVGGMELPKQLGTPGLPNSRSMRNAAPALWDVVHAPVLPQSGESFTVTARAADPDGITALELNYRVDPATAYTAIPMNDSGVSGDALAGDGIYTATVPGQAPGALVAFYVRATDGPGLSASYPDDAPASEALVRIGETTPSGTFPVYRLWMTQATFNRWASRSKLDNTPLPVAFVLDDSRVIQNARALYAGSPYIAPGYNTPTGRRCGYTVAFPADDKFLGDTDLVLDWPGGHGGESSGLQEQMAYWMADKMGLPYSHRYHIRLHVNGVTDMQRGTVFEAVNQPAGDFLEAWFPEGAEGDFYKIDRAFEFDNGGGLIADPQPRLQNYTTLGGAKKTERYRWTWLKRGGSDRNDYSNIFNLVDALNATSPEPYTSQTEALVDLEEWMGILAAEHIIVNFDAYGHEIGKNMYAFKPQNGRWQLYLFDLDWLMLAAAGRGGSYSPNSAALFNAEDPTMVRMYNHPPFRRAYFRAVKKAVEGPLVAANCDPVMDAKYQSLVANGITLCDGQSLTSPAAVKTWFRQRRAFLSSQLNAVAAEFAITSNGGADFTTNSGAVTLTGTAPIEVKSLLINGAEHPLTWTSVTGWELTLSLQPGVNVFAVQAAGADGAILENLSGRISITANYVPESPIGKVVINEIMANPAIPGAEFVELRNLSTASTFDLSGWRLEGADFTFPNGFLMEPGGYAVIAGNRAAFTTTYGNATAIAGESSQTLDLRGGTLSLKMPSPGAAFVNVDSVSFSSKPPWPTTEPGVSLQLISPEQDNSRVINWGVAKAAGNTPPPVDWQYVTATGTASSSRLYVYLSSAGEVYLDDLELVAGEKAGVGQNLIPNGDFESDFPGSWVVSANLAGSSASPGVGRSGSASLHLLSTAPGSSRDSSIWQDIGPLEQGAVYTLSYWYLQNTNGGGLTIRLSGNGVLSSHEIAPPETRDLLSTPGQPNSVPTALPLLPSVWINEFAPAGTFGAADSEGATEPWVELYNAGAESVSLAGWHLADNYDRLAQWSFPLETVIGPNQFLVVWLDGETEESNPSELHASFRPAVAGGSLALVFPLNGTPAVLDFAEYAGAAPNWSLGLYPDGVGGVRRFSASPSPGHVNGADSPSLPVYLNEWMAANSGPLANPVSGQLDDWFELFNPNEVPVDLGGYLLSDSVSDTAARWKIPRGTMIPARGFLLVWADGEANRNSAEATDLHASFRLSQDGETLVLFTPEGVVRDSVSFGPQTNGVSQGRFPDGNASISPLTVPTPRDSNAGPVVPPEEIVVRVFTPEFSDTGDVILSWTARSGRKYRIQTRENLGAGQWIDFGTVTVNGGVGSQTLRPTGSGQCFYRVVDVTP